MDVTPAQRRLLQRIRRDGPVRAGDLAAALDTTSVAVRQHLQALEAAGLVEATTEAPQGRGRPATSWSVTDAARRYLPDSHAELTVGLLDAIEASVGAAGLRKILRARGEQQAEAYRPSIDTSKPIGTRVKALAKLRERDGYMAEAKKDAGTDGIKGAWLLLEHHCPVCEAASRCRGICSVELDVFRDVLGHDVDVTRVEHVLESGDRRCVYRVAPRGE